MTRSKQVGLYRIVKGAVPLKVRVGLHSLKRIWPNDVKLRVRNLLSGGIPIPPDDLIHLVAGHRSAEAFLNGGRTASEAIRETLEQNGIDAEQFNAILDFGCGVGRIMRQWSTMRKPLLHGTDYNPRLIEWCKKHLKFAEFQVNTLSGGLPYESGTFDFIYAWSVFTHLQESLQFYWLDELSRVLKPGGYIYLTTHGEYYFSTLSPEEQRQFRSGQLVVRGDAQQSGSNFCGAYHPASYVRETVAARNFSVVDFAPSGARGDSMHDIYLIQKPERSSDTQGG